MSSTVPLSKTRWTTYRLFRCRSMPAGSASPNRFRENVFTAVFNVSVSHVHRKEPWYKRSDASVYTCICLFRTQLCRTPTQQPHCTSQQLNHRHSTNHAIQSNSPAPQQTTQNIISKEIVYSFYNERFPMS